MTTSVASNGDTIMSEIYIDAPPEQVFQAIVDPELVVQWWGGQGAGQGFRCTQFQSDVRPGGKWRSTGVDTQGHPFEASGEYLEVDPPRLLVQTWVASWTTQMQTTVRWELQPTGQGTLVKHQHCGLSAHPEVAKSFRGWPRILGWLQGFLEKGVTVDDRWSDIAP
jgi:uncharacterized protein YndB with AHSA1/START domain